jgi:mono/diheme cytochrome c family protein
LSSDRARLAAWPAAALAAAIAVPACAPRHQTPAAPAEPGARSFRHYCAACHQYDGQGMGDAPPLAGSPWINGPDDRFIRLVMHGVRGRMEIEGKIYDQEMPGFGQVLPDDDLAALLSFVRRRFGSPAAPIPPAAVARVRAESAGRTAYWSVQELLGGP